MNAHLIRITYASATDDLQRARAAMAALIAMVNRLAKPDEGELLTLDDYRQIARNTLARIGGVA